LQPTARTRRATPVARRDAASAPLPTLAPLVKCAALRNANDGHESHCGGSPACGRRHPRCRGADPRRFSIPAGTASGFVCGRGAPCGAGGQAGGGARIRADLLWVRGGGGWVVMETRPGAGTMVATAAPAKAPADGYTMLVATNSLLINPAIGQRLPYDTEKD